MDSNANPYQSPEAVDDGVRFVEVRDENAGDRIGERTVEALATSQKWVQLLGWGMVLLGAWHGLQTLQWVRLIPGNDWGILGPAAISFVNVVLYGAGGVLLLRYASQITDFSISRRIEHLDGALEALQSFWRFCGTALAVIMILIAGAILFTFLVSGAAGLWNWFS